MATFRLSNKILDLDGTPIPNVEVAISLFPKAAFRVDSGSEIAAIETIHSDSTGAWTVVIEGNENINPSGSYYEIEERIPKKNGGTRVWRARLTGDSGLVAALTPQPVPPGSVPNYATEEWVSENFLRKDDAITGPVGPPGPPGYTGFISSTTIPASSTDISAADVIVVEVPFTGVKGRMYHLSGWLNLYNVSASLSYATITMNDGVNILYSANETSSNGEYDSVPLDINFAAGSENRNVRIQLKIRVTPISPSPTAAARVTGGNLLLEDIGESSQTVTTVGMVQPSVFNTAWGKLGEARYTAGPVTNTANPIPILGALAVDAKRYKDRRYKITAYVVAEVAAAGQAAIFQITRNGTAIQSKTLRYTDNANLVEILITDDCVSDDTVTYAVAVDNSGAAGGVKLDGSLTAPSFIMVEDFGPVTLAAPENWPPNFPTYGSTNVGSGGFANDSQGWVTSTFNGSQPTIVEAGAMTQLATVTFRAYKNHKYQVTGFAQFQAGSAVQIVNAGITEGLNNNNLNDLRSISIPATQYGTVYLDYILDPATYFGAGVIPDTGTLVTPVARAQVPAGSGQVGLKLISCKYQVIDLGIQGVPTPDGVSGPSVWNVAWGLMATLPQGSLGTVTIPSSGVSTPVTNNTAPVTFVNGRRYQIVPTWTSFLGPAGSTAQINVTATSLTTSSAPLVADVTTSGFGEALEIFWSAAITATYTINVSFQRITGGPMTVIAGPIQIYDVGPTATRPDAFWPAGGSSGGSGGGGGGGNESVGVVWDASFPGQVTLPAPGTWAQLALATFQGLAGHAYECSGYAACSSGSSADTANIQTVDLSNVAADAYGATITMQAFQYNSAVLSQVVECGNTARTMQVQVRGFVNGGSYGAKLEHGRLLIKDLGIQGTATPMGYYAPSIWNVAWGRIGQVVNSLGTVTAPTATGGANQRPWIQNGNVDLVAGRRYKMTPSWVAFQGPLSETVVFGIKVNNAVVNGFWFQPTPAGYELGLVEDIFYDCTVSGTYAISAYVERVLGTGNMTVNGKEIDIEDVGPTTTKAPAYWVPATGPSIWETGWGQITKGNIGGTGAFNTTPTGFYGITWAAVAGRKYKISGWVVNQINGGSNTMNIRLYDTIALVGLQDVGESNNDGYYSTIPFEVTIDVAIANAAYKVDLQGWMLQAGGSSVVNRGFILVEDVGPVTPGQSYNWPPANATFPKRCLSTSRPASPLDGDQIYETDTKRILSWNGTVSKWRGIRSYQYLFNGGGGTTPGNNNPIVVNAGNVPDQGCDGRLQVTCHLYYATSVFTDGFWVRLKAGATEFAQWRSMGGPQQSNVTLDLTGTVTHLAGNFVTIQATLERIGGSGTGTAYNDATLNSLNVLFIPDA